MPPGIRNMITTSVCNFVIAQKKLVQDGDYRAVYIRRVEHGLVATVNQLVKIVALHASEDRQLDRAGLPPELCTTLWMNKLAPDPNPESFLTFCKLPKL